MSTGEIIIVASLLVFFVCIMLLITWQFFTCPYFWYELKKRSNRLQWKCEETYTSIEKRENNEQTYYECTVCFRILPSELNWFTRVFSDNSWKYPFESKFKFENQDDFKKYVSKFKTYGDFKDWQNKNIGVLWYEP